MRSSHLFSISYMVFLLSEDGVNVNSGKNLLRQGSHARDSSSATARSSPVILSAAKDLAADRDRPFASLRVTGSISKCPGAGVQVIAIALFTAIVYDNKHDNRLDL